MNLVDSCGWLEYFTDGPNADFYSAPLVRLQELIVPTIILYEVFKKIITERDEAQGLQAITLMKQGHVVDLDTGLALAASKISVDFRIPMADSIILATAKSRNALLWTQNGHFKNIPDVKFKIKRK